MNKKQKKMLIRILLSAAMLIGFNFLPVTGLIRFVLYLIPYVVIGYDILIKAFRGIKNRQPFDESLLMAIATLGAIVLAIYSEVVEHETGDYVEAIAVMLFYQVGEWFQSYAVGKSRRNISDLMDIRPDYANVEADGKLCQVDPDEVEPGSVIVVQPGEKVPIDGVIVGGSSTLNTSALTGESLPRDAKEGDEIISGCINMTGVLKIRTTKEFGTPPSRRSWIWWRMPARGSRNPRPLSQDLPGSTPLRSFTAPSPLRCCRRWCACSVWASQRTGAPGSTGR